MTLAKVKFTKKLTSYRYQTLRIGAVVCFAIPRIKLRTLNNQAVVLLTIALHLTEQYTAPQPET